MSVTEDLVQFYEAKSKHSNYQILPHRLREILGSSSLNTKSRYEQERLDYILSKVGMSGKTAIDIGGNTGFFTFELLDAGASHVTHYEGNKEHSDFVKMAAEALGDAARVNTVCGYYEFDGSDSNRYDVMLLLNVLHHVGFDYGDRDITIDEAKDHMMNQLNGLAKNADCIVLQIGFNWQGDISKGLFANGTKREMIDYIQAGVRDTWDVAAIGVAERVDGVVTYHDLNDRNVARDDSLGEFLNRPIFILKSKGA